MTLSAEPLQSSELPPSRWKGWELPPTWTYGDDISLKEAFCSLKPRSPELKELEDCLWLWFKTLTTRFSKKGSILYGFHRAKWVIGMAHMLQDPILAQLEEFIKTIKRFCRSATLGDRDWPMWDMDRRSAWTWHDRFMEDEPDFRDFWRYPHTKHVDIYYLTG